MRIWSHTHMIPPVSVSICSIPQVASSSTEAATLGGIAKVNVADRWQTGTAFPHDVLLNEMREAQILIDIAVTTAMLMLRVAPLPTFSPLVIRRCAK